MQHPVKKVLGSFFCVWVLASSTANAASVYTLANGFEIYNTGILVSGGVDQRWYMTENPFNGSSDANLNTAGYLSANTADSAWIGPSFANVNTPESVYAVAIDSVLTGIDLSSVELAGFWVTDNQGLDIRVNGFSTGQTNNGNHPAAPSASPANAFSISLEDGLISGINTIEFVWGNGPAGGAGSQNPNPTHARVEFTSAASSVIPIPAAVWLFGSALAALGWRRAIHAS